MTKREVLKTAEDGVERMMDRWVDANNLDHRPILETAAWFATVALAMRAALNDDPKA